MIIGLACSACGSTHTVQQPTTPTRATSAAKVAPVALGADLNFVVLPPTHGAGNAMLGTFTEAGQYGAIMAQCAGKGSMRVAGLWTVPCNPNFAEGGQLGFDTAGKRINLTVRAKPGTTWWLAVGEHIPVLRKLAPPTVVLLHRTGVGNESFGPMRLRGKFQIEDACRGTGQLKIYVWSLSSTGRRTGGLGGNETYCPEGRFGWSGSAGRGRRVLIDIHAGRKATWTLTLKNVPGK